MKAAILLVFSVLLINGLSMGQTPGLQYSVNKIKRDLYVYDSLYDNQSMGLVPNINKHLDQNIYKKSPNIYSDEDSLLDKNYKDKHYYDFVIVEEYPGSSRFYGNPFCIKPDTRGKLFVIKPDTTNKYYLLIKDPLGHRTIKKSR